jgi:hypothetical protein
MPKYRRRRFGLALVNKNANEYGLVDIGCEEDLTGVRLAGSID